MKHGPTICGSGAATTGMDAPGKGRSCPCFGGSGGDVTNRMGGWPGSRPGLEFGPNAKSGRNPQFNPGLSPGSAPGSNADPNLGPNHGSVPGVTCGFMPTAGECIKLPCCD